MTQRGNTLVTTSDGLQGTIIEHTRASTSGEPQVLVRFDNQQVLVPTATLVLQKDGSYYLPLDRHALEGIQSVQANSDKSTVVLPVIEEELDVQKRKVTTGVVRVSKLVREREEVVDEPLLREQVDVERVPINQVVESPVSVRREGDTLIIPILEEVLVVEKRLMLKEELRVNMRRTTVHEPQTVTLRTEEARVEHVEPSEQVRQEGAGTKRA